MKTPRFGPAFRGRRLAGVGVCALLALACAVWNLYSISLLPPKIAARDLRNAGAAAHVVVDRQRSTIDDRYATGADFQALDRHASTFANLLSSKLVLTEVARQLRIPVAELDGSTPVTVSAPAAFTEPDAERRAHDIAFSKLPYRIVAEARPTNAEVDVYTRAPTVAEAQRLADVSIAVAHKQLDQLTADAGLSDAHRLTVTQLGPASGAVLSSARKLIGVLTFIVVFAIGLGVRLIVGRTRHGWVAARSAELQQAEQGNASGPAAAMHDGALRFAPVAVGAHAGTVALGGSITRTRPRSVALGRPFAGGGAGAPPIAIPRQVLAARIAQGREVAARGGDWPRTTRMLPWMIAAFIVMLWLVPFNTVKLGISTPIDLQLDRLVLPLIVGVWLIAMAVGRRGAPRLRLTWIHAGIGAYIAFSFLSVVIDARYLNDTLELVMGIKQLFLLTTYGLMFLVIASTVRREEVPAFLKLMLWCGILCSVGIIYEYRTHTNLFYLWTDKLLPGIFAVAPPPAGFDAIGRPAVIGPAQLGLEAVAMLTMAFPIAIVGLLQTQRRRDRVLYGLAAILILAAATSTYRKSAFIAPVMALMTIAYFRRRELLRLAPLGLVGIVAVHVLSPGSLGSVAVQLHSNHLDVATVNDRTSDYDAIRPDVWSHLAFGRGFGTYDHLSYRILDSEILGRLVETGVVGLVLYWLMFASIVAVARPAIRARDPKWSSIALMVAAGTVGFATMSFLYDVMSFPHAPYLLICLAGMIAVVIKGPAETPPTSSTSTDQRTYAHPHVISPG